jgi:hypothetical protein
MKCIKKDGEIRRVSDVDADLKVKVHGWAFAPKPQNPKTPKPLCLSDISR